MNPAPAHIAFTFSANRCVVDVDTELGLARVVQMDIAQYAGRVVNPVQAHGQVCGGSMMGLGLALMENLSYFNGQPTNSNWGAYLLPTIADAPVMNSEFIDVLEPGIPLGLNGTGEIPHVQAPPSILSALRAATGVHLSSAPATPAILSQVESPEPPRLSDIGWSESASAEDQRIGKFLRFQLVKRD